MSGPTRAASGRWSPGNRPAPRTDRSTPPTPCPAPVFDQLGRAPRSLPAAADLGGALPGGLSSGSRCLQLGSSCAILRRELPVLLTELWPGLYIGEQLVKRSRIAAKFDRCPVSHADTPPVLG